MNILKVKKEDIVSTNSFKLINNVIKFENLDFEKDFYIGIRPEDISLDNTSEISMKITIDLVENLGGKPTPGIGFAAGMERILLLINEKQQKANKPSPDIYFICLEKAGLPHALSLSNKLRMNGFKIISDSLRRSMKAQMREANKSGAKYVLILGEKELSENTILFKNLENSHQKIIKQKKIIKFFGNLTN